MSTKIILTGLFAFLILCGMTGLTNVKPETEHCDLGLLCNQSPDNIKFSFTAKKMRDFRGVIEIDATLHNNSTDTVYFLTSSCEGEQYSLQYDTSKYILNPFIRCFSSWPQLAQIGPSGSYRFKAHFNARLNDSKMKLGFDFYIVDRKINMSKINLSMIYNRPDKEQHIIWSDDVLITDSATNRQQGALRKRG